MARPRWLRVTTDGIRLGLFLVATYAAARFLIGALRMEDGTPGALFGLLLVIGGISLAWRAALDLKRSIRRLR
jgi:hypothetical protein